MREGPKSTKIHIQPEDTDQGAVGPYEIVIPLCTRPVPAEMTMDLETVESLARKNFSKKAFCTTCLQKSGIDFPNRGTEERLDRVPQPA